MTSQRTGQVGVAISTTGHEHRLEFLETAVAKWCEVPDIHSLFVTVDGTEDDAARVAEAVREHTMSVYRVGQPQTFTFETAGRTRQGVAANKNTGLELLMNACGRGGYPDIEHLFLADDDVYPLGRTALDLHINLSQPHSVVMWGKHRLRSDTGTADWASWLWPRGVVQYVRREIVAAVGGMDERFYPGGHEHVEWSQRIHNRGFTLAPYVSPFPYARYGRGARPREAMGAEVYWWVEDTPKWYEARHEFHDRQARFTTLRQTTADWERIEVVMAERDGDTSFVSFRAEANGRDAATLCSAT